MGKSTGKKSKKSKKKTPTTPSGSHHHHQGSSSSAAAAAPTAQHHHHYRHENEEENEQMMPHYDMNSFLRTIPEDRSDLASSLALQQQSTGTPSEDFFLRNNNNNNNNNTASSVRAVDAGREGSVISAAAADVPDTARVVEGAPSQRRHGGHGRRHRRKPSSSSLCALAVTLLVIAGAVVAIIIVAVSDGPNSNNNSPPVSDSPTTSPTIDPETVAALDEILFTLHTMQDLQSSPLLDPSQQQQRTDDPRLRARAWMLYEDLLRDEYLAANYPPAILQRFALVELYYATGGGTSWNVDEDLYDDDDDSEASEDVALWENENATATASSFAFLTPEASECDWYGITCTQDEDSNYHVRKIVLPAQNLTGTLPSSLYILPELGEINLTQNALTGPLPTAWFTAVDDDDSSNQDSSPLPSLFVLDLERNQLTGTIPPTLWSRPVMRFVYLNDNRLSGPVFDESTTYNGNVSLYLEDVWLQGNGALTGPLPWWLWNLPLLSTFWVDDNQFTGPLPDPPASTADVSPSLYWLSVSNNNLTGPLQANHFAGGSLDTIRLNDNAFSGPLPEKNLASYVLQVVWLHNNNFSGVLPADFGAVWFALVDLRLTGNPNLSGSVSDNQCLVWQSSWAATGRRLEADCPPIVCSCCTNAECQQT